MKNKVIIFGAGISGLSAAHELIEKGYEVSVYEKLSEPGGVARSYRKTPSSIPSEYSWRGYGAFYYNTFELMKKIPVDGNGNDKTVYDNLSRPIHFIFTKNKGNFTDALSLKDKIILYTTIAKVASSGDERTSYYASVNASEYMKSRMSQKGWEQFISMFGPWVGIDPQRSSLYHVMFFIIVHFLSNPKTPFKHRDKNGEWEIGTLNWSVFNKPTNEAWFEPWVKHLKNLGVKFYFDHESYSINLDCDDKPLQQKVVSVIVKNTKNDDTFSVTADHYVMAISPFGLRDVLERSTMERSNPSRVLLDMYDQAKQLTQDGPHIQVSFRIGFDKEFSWVGERRPVIISDSEFNITMYRQDELWEDDVYLGPNIKSLWSGTSCVSYIPGTLFGKPVTKLTKDQFEKEILHQLSKDKGFNDLLSQKIGKKFAEILPHVIHFEVWKNWKFVDENCGNSITIIEPKYVDSVNTRPHQFHTKTSLSNLWMAGGHTRTSTGVWSMEAASEAGRKAADMISGDSFTIEHDKGTILKSLGIMDDVLYRSKMPSVIDVIILLLIILFFFFIYFYLFHQRK